MPKIDFMAVALREAKKASLKNEIPIGVVIVKDGKIIARAYNQTEQRGHFAAHAELIAIQKASRKLNSKYLLDCDLYVTLEPCLMCYTAARLARIPRLHFLLRSEKFGRRGKAYPKIKSKNYKSALTQDAKHLLASFFREKR